jgi:hypothetical protein
VARRRCEINQVAIDLARLQGLRAAAISFWMGALLGGPRRKRGAAPPDDELRAWRLCLTTLGKLMDEVEVEVEAWLSLEQRYLGGHRCLFQDAATEWARLEGHLESVERMAEVVHAGLPSGVGRERQEDESGTDEPTEAGVARARWLADSARVKAFELLGERPRAARIMERRLRLVAPTR